jgi:hypothetical protein
MALHTTWPMTTSSTSESDIRYQTPVDLVTVRSVEEVNLLSKVIREASYNGSVYLTNHPHTSKFTPRKSKGKQKPVSKVSVARPRPQQSLATTPVLLAPTVVTDDNELYALWLDFHHDKSQVMKTIAYPVDAKVRVERQRSQRCSKLSKQGIETVRALGLTPRKIRGTAKGSFKIPFWSNSDFKQIEQDNRSYMKELSVRYRDFREIGAVIPAFRLWNDHINSANPVMEVSRKDQVSVENTALIAILEQQLSAAPKMESISMRQMRRDDAVARAEAKVFDLYEEEVTSQYEIVDQYTGDTARLVGPVVLTPSVTASNDSVFDACETQHEQEQWVDWDIYDQYEAMAMGKTPVDCELVAYYKQLRGDSIQDNGKYLIPVGVYDSEQWMRETEGPTYARWLAKYSVLSNGERLSTETVKSLISPGYCMDLGTHVHILEQMNMDTFNIMVASKTSRRIAMFDYGILRNDSAANWLRQHMPRKCTAVEQVSIPVITVEQIEAKQGRVIKETLFDNIINQYESKARFRNWVAYAESEVVPVLTDVVEDTTQMVSDTTIKQDSPSSYNAEVVSLTERRNKNKEGIKNLTSSMLLGNFKEFISTLTREQQDDLIMLIEANRRG